MKIHVIGSPRSGGTALAKQISVEKSLPFVNEPYQFDFIHNRITVDGVPIGGGINSEEYVSHSIASHYFVRNKLINTGEQLVLVERQNKWDQLLSYVIMSTLASELKKIHNYNFTESRTITVDKKYLNYMLYEWSIFDLLKANLSNYGHLYYEDIQYGHHIGFTKNRGYDNIIITNIDEVKHYFTLYQGSK
jgi:hypothetical protein